MHRSKAALFLGAMGAVLLATMPAAADCTLYTTEAAFLDALDGGTTRETFDGFDSGTEINDQIPGLFIDAPGESSAAVVIASEDAVSQPNVLSGGVPGPSGIFLPQALQLDFDPSIGAIAFYLTNLDPLGSAAGVTLSFDDEGSQNASIEDSDDDATTPEFFGAICTSAINSALVRSGSFAGGEAGVDVFGIDDLIRASGDLGDCCDPTCDGNPLVVDGILGISGTGRDSSEFGSGLESIVLQEGAENVALTVDEFEAGDLAVDFRTGPIDPLLDGQGTVLVTDVAGKACSLPVTFRAIDPGPVSGELICSGGGTLLSVTNLLAGPGGPAACSVEAPGDGDPALPPGYEPSPEDDPFPCTVMTIQSPISGLTDMTYKKDGDFEPRLRLLFSHFDGAAFPPFTDISESVDQITTVTPDPTRVKGSGGWSQVKVTCAVLGEICNGADDDGDGSIDEGLPVGGAAVDADGDGVPLCPASAGGAFDCNDQIAAIHPGAGEACNGMDDDCDSGVDEGQPADGEACSIPGLLGVCAEGETSCEAGPLVCAQVNLPSDEVCDGADNDCDGTADEGYVFGGYLQPVNPDGSSIFRRGNAVPFKFRLTDCGGAVVSTATARIHVFFYSNGVVGTEVEDVGSVGSANTDNQYRYDPTGQQYIYNLSTLILRSNTTYLVRTTLDDGTEHDVLISIR